MLSQNWLISHIHQDIQKYKTLIKININETNSFHRISVDPPWKVSNKCLMFGITITIIINNNNDKYNNVITSNIIRGNYLWKNDEEMFPHYCKQLIDHEQLRRRNTWRRERLQMKRCKETTVLWLPTKPFHKLQAKSQWKNS